MASWIKGWILLSLALLAGLLSADIQNTPQVMTQAQLAKASQQYGMLAEKRFKAWQELVDTHLNKPEAKKLEAVNDFFNQAQFVDDILHWKQKDYWATPIEFLGTDAGDCEDYVIAKYFTLKALRVPEEKLYLTYVKAIRLKQAHMVLTYFETPKSVPLVLDNINKRILPATQRNDLAPVYSFNGDGLWLAKQRGKGKEVSGGTQKLTKWNALLEKMHHD